MTISSFRGDNSWLSNFAPVEVEYDGVSYFSVEHAYQAAKTTDVDTRKLIASAPECKNTKPL